MPTDTNLRSGLIRLAASLPADKRAPLLQILACDHAATEKAGGECCGMCDTKTARYEEGVSADPTENMSPEDAAEWRKQNEIHRDNFKTAAAVSPEAAHLLSELGSGWEIVTDKNGKIRAEKGKEFVEYGFKFNGGNSQYFLTGASPSMKPKAPEPFDKMAAWSSEPGQKMELSDAMIQIVKHLRYCQSGKFGPVGQQALSDVMALVVELMNGTVLSPDDRDLIRDRALAHAHKFVAETKFILPSSATGMKQPMAFTASKTYVLKSELKLKSGDTITTGTKASVGFDKQKHSIAIVQFDGRAEPVRLSVSNLHKYFSGMSKPPTEAALEKMDDQGHCKTVTGYKVEPDGTGPDGSPSWLLAMGMV